MRDWGGSRGCQDFSHLLFGSEIQILSVCSSARVPRTLGRVGQRQVEIAIGAMSRTSSRCGTPNVQRGYFSELSLIKDAAILNKARPWLALITRGNWPTPVSCTEKDTVLVQIHLYLGKDLFGELIPATAPEQGLLRGAAVQSNQGFIYTEASFLAATTTTISRCVIKDINVLAKITNCIWMKTTSGADED